MIDVGVPVEVLQEGLGRLGLAEGLRVAVSRQVRGTISAVKVEVVGGSGQGRGHGHDQSQAESQGDGKAPTADRHDPHGHHHAGEVAGEPGHGHGRAFQEIRELIERSGLSEGVKARSLAIFGKVAEAEAKIHGTTVEAVHFHEVGAVDSIGDIVGAALALEHVGVEVVRASVPREGTGFVECAHGRFPLPAPATAEILRGIPVEQCGVPHELITPTGAAILAACVASFGPLRGLAVERLGYGAGTRELAGQPNVLRVMVGREALVEGGEAEEVEVWETNLDDATPEELALAVEGVLAAGALDVVVAPVTMKKGRAGWLVQMLARLGEGRGLAEFLVRHTSAFGLRMHRASRLVLGRKSEVVETQFGPLPVKLGFLGGELVQARPEFEPARRAADRFGVSLHEVYRVVEEAAAKRRG